MPRRKSTTGKCSFCGGTFGKAAMARHLTACPKRQAEPAKRKATTDELFHLVVQGRYAPDYWMHLDVRANTQLTNLDQFLRDIWLECCGHLSVFTIRGERYAISPIRDAFWDMGERSMNVALADVLEPGMKFEHEYDFGTTTELALRIVSKHEGNMGRRPVLVLARNDPPDIRCQTCGKPATDICVECDDGYGAWLCADCAAEHEHDDMPLPVVNSPRVGVCAYTG